MSELRTDEEQVEALKAWWNENGKSMMIAVIVAVSAVLGWKAWQQKTQSDKEQASATYQNLLDALANELSSTGSDDPSTRATSQHLAQELKEQHEGSEYARLASLLMARTAVEQQQYDLALQELDWALTHNPDEQMKAIINLRKARIYQAQNAFDQGLAVLKSITLSDFLPQAAEVKGDILVAAGKLKEARKAYEKALSATSTTERPLLAIKLEDLATSTGE